MKGKILVATRGECGWRWKKCCLLVAAAGRLCRQQCVESRLEAVPYRRGGVYEETIYFVCGACGGARRFRRGCTGAVQEWRAGHRAATSYVEPAGDRYTADWAYGHHRELLSAA